MGGVAIVRRVGFWGLAGLGVACFWVTLGILLGPGFDTGQWLIAAITAPASLLGRATPLAYSSFALLNAGIYALLGLGTELLRRAFR